MKLGAFSVSLSVADLAASRSFYEALGFARIGGDPAQGWVILRNGACTLGLFQGMFEGNMLTFNPGWTADAAPEADFTDIRAIQDALRTRGLEIARETDPEDRGPADILLHDPDGNAILVDQHVPAPE